jgi:hypothetical protein
MSRFIAACVVMALAVSGVAPCAIPRAAGAMANHDCCDPEQMDAAGALDAGAVAVTAGPPDCCAVSAGAQAPAAMPVVAPAAERSLAASTVAVPCASGTGPSDARVTTRDLRSRSAPRPALVPVLLI